jgi:16S rRNA (uracil1498-N3)-methyltransferase
MPENRFYFDGELEGIIELADDELRHLRVMRREVGDHIELVNGRGVLAKGVVTAIAKKSASIQIEERVHTPYKGKKIILAQTLPRLHNLDTIIEKGTELGAFEFWLFPAARSEKKELSESQQRRLRHLTISALKQCGRLYLPAIHVKPALEKWDALPFKGFFGDVRPEAKMVATFPNDLIFFIGPESGFTEAETAQLEKWGVTGVKLHENILRVDTAAIVALSLAGL